MVTSASSRNSSKSMGKNSRVSPFNDDDDHDRPHSHDPEFRGPIKNRSCTDVLCLLLFLAFVAGWVVVAVYAFGNGDPQRIIYPSNSRGEICGRTTDEYDYGYERIGCTNKRLH